MKNYLLFLLLILSPQFSFGQEVAAHVFELIDLDYPGLEKVKKNYNEGNLDFALDELLSYYRGRQGINHPDIDLNQLSLSPRELKIADEGLKHQFFVHKGYQPSFFYGEDIDWTYWPVKDNELRWQLHRTKWWQPMGKAYQVSKDEKYAKEWTLQYLDWIYKNPLLSSSSASTEEVSSGELASVENVRFAWRPLEVSHRLQDQTIQFLLFQDSEYFTPAFLSQFLCNYHKHAEHILGNYSQKGNHLLFEAQRMIYAGAFFPEFKQARTWRSSGISILNREIKKQVYADGMHFELDPHYHLAAINIFAKAIRVADANGFRNEFGADYLSTVEKMIEWVINCHFPNYTNPMFSDAKQDTKQEMLKNYQEWEKIFPENLSIRYMASDRQRGAAPEHLSKAFLSSGFYVFRNGWTEDAIQMTLKAGPPAFWHSQPDNGTFELFIKGRNFFPDSGSYVYAGSAEVNKQRAWFKQTRVHNTLTLNRENMSQCDSKNLIWDRTTHRIERLVYENPSYEGLTHRRSVFFVDQSFFILVDEAIGEAEGKVAIHYNLCEGDFKLDNSKHRINSEFEDDNNLVLQVFSPSSMAVLKEEGWVSYAYRQKAARDSFAFELEKKDKSTVRFISVILPTTKPEHLPKIKASFIRTQADELQVQVQINKKKYRVGYRTSEFNVY